MRSAYQKQQDYRGAQLSLSSPVAPRLLHNRIAHDGRSAPTLRAWRRGRQSAEPRRTEGCSAFAVFQSSCQPGLDFRRRDQDHLRRLGVDRSHDLVGIAGQEAGKIAPGGLGDFIKPRAPIQRRPYPGEKTMAGSGHARTNRSACARWQDLASGRIRRKPSPAPRGGSRRQAISATWGSQVLRRPVTPVSGALGD